MKLHDFEKYPINLYKGNKLIGTTYSLVTFDDFRLQVKEEQSEEYSFEFKGLRYYLTKNGRYAEYPIDKDFPDDIHLRILGGLI